MITNTTKLVDIFNTHYITIAEKSSGTPPNIKGNPENHFEDGINVKRTIHMRTILVLSTSRTKI